MGCHPKPIDSYCSSWLKHVIAPHKPPTRYQIESICFFFPGKHLKMVHQMDVPMDVPRFQAQAQRFQDGERWKCREAGDDRNGRSGRHGETSVFGVVFFGDL